ncbi:hypothetical protein BJ508DRAFT_328057 [Ascobolus immersus RN42]|uniref:Uncharacterized protein n=1 Tax=Ascobolus immersus RN42 TaxID=1160509 RepID=A0A3N4I152_ASCIM|nr:hypothetical protein BJ508DRAFT_328057 [Ascobolus immersus RN42]
MPKARKVSNRMSKDEYKQIKEKMRAGLEKTKAKSQQRWKRILEERQRGNGSLFSSRMMALVNAKDEIHRLERAYTEREAQEKKMEMQRLMEDINRTYIAIVGEAGMPKLRARLASKASPCTKPMSTTEGTLDSSPHAIDVSMQTKGSIASPSDCESSKSPSLAPATEQKPVVLPSPTGAAVVNIAGSRKRLALSSGKGSDKMEAKSHIDKKRINLE